MNGLARNPAPDDTLTIWPLPRAIMSGTKLRQPCTTPMTLIASWRSQSSSSVWTKLAPTPTPALLISRSTPPKRVVHGGRERVHLLGVGDVDALRRARRCPRAGVSRRSPRAPAR